jgi:POT family proton-dependent oligopeptide transporter
LIVIGTGLLKPNVSSMVGTLYAADDPRRDSGFSVFYMGINIGAGAAPIVCGWLGQRVDWHWGFAAAGFGMVIGIVQYVIGRRWVEEVRVPSREISTPAAEAKSFTPAEWKRVIVILVLFLFAILFWGAFEQSGSTLTLFADRYTRLTLFGWSFPSSWFQVEQPVFVLILAPTFAWLWLRLGSRQPSSAMKFALGLILVGLGYLWIVPAAASAQQSGARVSPIWLTVLYLVHTFGEMCLSPVGLSIVTKLSPKRIVGLMMGVWFLGTSFGSKLAGWVASFFDVVPVSRLFLINALTTIIAGVILLLLARSITRLTSGKTEPT